MKARGVQVGVKNGGKYAGGLIPDPRLISGVGTIGVDGYNKMLANIKGGIDPTKPAPAAPSVAPAATPAPAPLISAASPAQNPAQPTQPTQQPAAVPGKVAAPAPKPMELSNGVDNGSGLQITNGFETPAPATPAPTVAAPAGQQPAQPQQAQQPQKFARGKVPALIDGVVRGPGGPAEDKVPAKVSPKEAILPAATVAALGGPEAIAALIKATNNGKAPESEVEEGGKYAGGLVPVDILGGLREAIVNPLVDDARQVNRVAQKEYPLSYQAAQLHPAVGISTAAANYADAMDAGDTSGAIAASLSGIPIIEKGYKVGAAVAKGAKDLIGSGGVRSAVNALGRRFGAGEQAAESFDAGVQHGSGYVQANPVQTGVKQGYARGKVPALIDGVVRGPGGPTEDKVPAKVSPKEAILPAATVAALGGPEAIAALIKATNNGQAPESEVEEGGEYAVGYNGMPEEDPYTKRTGQPNMYAEDNRAIREFADKNILPATRQAIGAANADVSQAQAEGRGAYATGRALRGLGEAAAAVPADVYDVGRKGANAIGELAGSAVDAVKPTAQGFWSGLTGAQPKQQTPSARPAAAPSVAADAAPANPEYGNEGRGNPAALISSIGKPQAPGKPLIGAALPSPSADTQVGTQGPQMGNSPDGYRDSMQQIANIKALSAGENKPERNNLGGTNWEADERQRRRDFDNFSARSDLNRALYDATRSGRPQAIQAAGGALTHFNAQADGQANKAGEFDNGMRALAAKSEQERAMEGVKGKNQIAAESVRGSNLLAAEGMRGQNSLLQEALRGKNQLSVADRQAESLQASREYMNPLDAQIKQGQLKDSQMRAQLRDRLLTASPEDQAVIARQIAAMDGKYQDRDGAEVTKARMSLVGDLLKAYNGPAGVPLGPDKQPIPFEQFAAPAMAAALGGGQAAQAPQAPDSAVSYLRANPQMAKAFDAKYGPGASAAYLGGR